jgi:branched-subunit amino acid transport protein
MSIWIAVLAAGAASFGLRAAFTMTGGTAGRPGWLARLTPFVMPSALAAMAAPAVFTHATGAAGDGAVVVVAALVTAEVSRRTHQPHRAVLAGMASVWLLSVVLAAS